MNKKLIGGILAVIIGFVGLLQNISCKPVAHTIDRPPVIMEVLDPSLERFAPAWQTEINRRFTNAVGILVHGGDFVESQWVLGTSYAPHKHVTPVAEVVRHHREMYPDRTLVLLACNPGHIKLGIPGVYYASSSVWAVPDRSVKSDDLNSFVQLTPTTSPYEFDPFTPIAPAPVPHPTRWEIDPDVVGSIFEFHAE